MTITVTNIGTANAKTVNSIAITVPVGGVPSGSLIVVAASESSTGGTPAASDTAGNTYNDAGGGTTISTASGLLDIKHAFNATALVSGNTITWTFGQTGKTGAASAFYVTGIDTSADPAYAVQGSSGSSATPSGLSAINIASGDFVVAFVATNGPIGDAFTQDSTNGAYATPPTRAGTTGAGATTNWTIAGGTLVANATQRWTYAPAITSRAWAVSVRGFKSSANAQPVVAEAASAAETVAASNASSQSIAEAGTATDAPSASDRTAVTVAETGSAADASSFVDTIAAAVAESGAAADATNGATAGASISESGAAADVASANGTFNVAIAEAGSAADSPSASDHSSVAVSEAGSAADASSASDRMSAAVVESGAATDAPSASQHASAAIVESGSAVDTTSSGGQVWNVSVLEAASATDYADFAGYVRHYTGVLVPKSMLPASVGLDDGNFNRFVAVLFPTVSYTTLPIDTGIDDTLRVFDSVTYALGPGESGAPALRLSIDTWLTGAGDPNTFSPPWTVGYVTMRYLRARLTQSAIAEGGVAYITGFTPEIDKAPTVESADSVVIAPGGTVVLFPTPFHFPPLIEVTPISGTALYATAAAVTATQMTVHVWNAGGTDVGGTVNYNAKGE
jgi:hypothetical protein